MKKLHPIAVTLGIAGVLASIAAVTLDKSLPYRIGFIEYPRHVWAERLIGVSVVLAVLTLLCGIAARKRRFPLVLGLISLSPVLIIGGVHSGPNPEAWCYNNLRQIEGAKEQLAQDRALTNGSSVTMADVSRLTRPDHELRCAEHGTYIINPIGIDARCTVHGSIPEMETNWQNQMRAQPDAATNRNQPVRPHTNGPSVAAASGR